jgi:Ser-tRNA(Ala) deacylase AlaX
MPIAPNLPETKLKYLQDTYLFEDAAKVLDVFSAESEDPSLFVVILDQTIFYPQGGGQPSDTGFMESQNSKFEVTKSSFDPNGYVWHFGHFLGEKFKVGEEVKLQIDSQKRLINAKNHTSGHLIDLAIEKLGWNLKPVKGYHFPEGPYVEYAGELEDLENSAKILEKTLNEIITANPKISFHFEDGKHSSGKPMRIMSVEGFSDCPCGGTHISSTDQLKYVTIKKIKNNKGNLKISYLVE